MEKPVWGRVLGKLVEEIEYGNFGDEVTRYQGRAGEECETALHEVWTVIREELRPACRMSSNGRRSEAVNMWEKR